MFTLPLRPVPFPEPIFTDNSAPVAMEDRGVARTWRYCAVPPTDPTLLGKQNHGTFRERKVAQLLHYAIAKYDINAGVEATPGRDSRRITGTVRAAHDQHHLSRPCNPNQHLKSSLRFPVLANRVSRPSELRMPVAGVANCRKPGAPCAVTGGLLPPLQQFEDQFRNGPYLSPHFLT